LVAEARRDGRPGETSSGRLRRFRYNRLKEITMRNPWLSLWLSAANSWAGAIRSFWIAELHRQQAAMANEMIRQTIDFWTRTGMAPPAGQKPKRRG
jgi:hypothetical protein